LEKTLMLGGIGGRRRSKSEKCIYHILTHLYAI